MYPEKHSPVVAAWHSFREWRNALFTRWHQGVNRRTLALLLAILTPLIALYLTAVHPPENFPAGDIVSVPRDAALSTIAESLAEQGVVRSPAALELIVRLMGAARSVHAGDYQFTRPVHVFTVARAIAYGYYGLEPVRIRIPEGSMTTEMAPIFKKHLPRFDEEAFVAKAKEQEGYLYPDTYFFLPNASEDIVLSTMRENFDKRVLPLLPEIEQYGRTLHEVVTMASLLEEEARIYEDKRKIAGVLWRRIEIGMPLQVDAAFLYFLGRTTFSLTLKDLQTDSPYNTYKYKGLPPGPISSPSIRSLEAAVRPIDTGAIFYLADFSGVTHYSKTYEEHLRKKRLYLGT